LRLELITEKDRSIATASRRILLAVPRLLAIVLLVSLILTVTLEAQRSVATFQGHAGLRAHSEFLGNRSLPNGLSPQRGLQNGFFPNHLHRHGRHNGVLFPYFFPEYDPFWYEQPEIEETFESAPSAMNEQRDGRQLGNQEKPVPKSQLIDIPATSGSTAAKTLPSTVFILNSGERLESREFLLTASDLSIKVNHHRLTIPLQMLNLDATRVANRERGIDLRIPIDRTEISLSF
jgi:hypothetical protein